MPFCFTERSVRSACSVSSALSLHFIYKMWGKMAFSDILDIFLCCANNIKDLFLKLECLNPLTFDQ